MPSKHHAIRRDSSLLLSFQILGADGFRGGGNFFGYSKGNIGSEVHDFAFWVGLESAS